MRHCYTNTYGLIYVVDSQDRERVNRAGSEFKVSYTAEQSSMISVLVLTVQEANPKRALLYRLAYKFMLGLPPASDLLVSAGKPNRAADSLP